MEQLLVNAGSADDLFALRANVCDRCGATFETSRRSRLCALCAGPQATVICPGCEKEHQTPILAENKFCRLCQAEPEMTRAAMQARYDTAKALATDLAARLDADVAHADETTRARFEAAHALLVTGQLGDRQLSVEQVRAAWQKAIDRGDDLSPLLVLYDRAAAAALAQLRMGEGQP